MASTKTNFYANGIISTTFLRELFLRIWLASTKMNPVKRFQRPEFAKLNPAKYFRIKDSEK